jgi:signal transduction histidine kinase
LIVTNTSTGRDVPILVNSAPLSDPMHAAAGAVAVFQDISPLHDLDRQRDQFLAAISHDLRTPVAVIKGRANLLQRAVGRSDRPDIEQVASGLQAIDDSTARLVRIIDELLDLMQMRVGHPVELDVSPTDLLEVARRVTAEYDGIGQEREIRVTSQLERLVGSWDPARIERVVANLVSNAVKYSDPSGEVSVQASIEEDDDQSWAVLAVQNRGIGIPASEIDRVFDTYYRGTNVSSSISGAGVGLAGVRHIVEQHGGRIEVESIEGGITTFTARLPLLAEAG